MEVYRHLRRNQHFYQPVTINLKPGAVIFERATGHLYQLSTINCSTTAAGGGEDFGFLAVFDNGAAGNGKAPFLQQVYNLLIG